MGGTPERPPLGGHQRFLGDLNTSGPESSPPPSPKPGADGRGETVKVEIKVHWTGQRVAELQPPDLRAPEPDR